MNIRAAIFDVYGTLLEVGPAPPQADEQWRELWNQMLGCEPRLSRSDFALACKHVVDREHEAARTRGIPYPEVDWPAIVAEVVPETQSLHAEAQAEFIQAQIRTTHTTSLTPCAAEALGKLKRAGCLLGIASNAQAYTLRELEEGLRAHGLRLGDFEPDLCFWSYKHGFSKPDPHAFQILSTRLRLRGIAPAQIIMVGDRDDNDIEPARRQGWKVCNPGALDQMGRSGWEQLIVSVGQS